MLELVSNNIKTEAMAEKYTLNWHTFSDHPKFMFKDLYQEGTYTDVTLVSDDLMIVESPGVVHVLQHVPASSHTSSHTSSTFAGDIIL